MESGKVTNDRITLLPPGLSYPTAVKNLCALFIFFAWPGLQLKA